MSIFDDKIIETMMDEMSDENTAVFQDMIDNFTTEEADAMKDAAARAAAAAYAIGAKDVIVKEIKGLALIGCAAIAVKLAKKLF